MRTSFLVDGFNLYHSLREAENDLRGAGTRWLDLRGLLSSYLYAIDPQARLEKVYYFSALARHLDATHPGHSARHSAYIDCLTSTGIVPVLGRFKRKDVWCRTCRATNRHHEEKETDVAISIMLIELFHLDACDTAVIVSGDTDIAPAVRTAAKLFPTKAVCFAFPYKRKNEELAKLASKTFRIRMDQYPRHQFPDPVVLPSGRHIPKPGHW